MIYINLFRIKHYFKNLIIFVPLFFSGKFFVAEDLNHVILGFLVFSFISSVIYIFNDIRDKEKDRKHPIKSKRPIASGKISVLKAYACIVLLLFVSFILSLEYLNAGALFLILVYLVMNVGYSLGLKNFPILDVSIVVCGFIIRIFFGGFVADVIVSDWLFLTILSASFYLALGKRRNELQYHKTDETRNVLNRYSLEFLDKNMYMCLALANCFYAMWAKAHVKAGMIYTVPIIIMLSICYSFDIEQVSEGDPIEVLTTDLKILCLLALYIVVITGFLYLS